MSHFSPLERSLGPSSEVRPIVSQRRYQILALVLAGTALLIWQIHRWDGAPVSPQSVPQAPATALWISGRGGTDNRARSLGVGGAEGYINAPTVFNSGFQFRYFWDGRERSLEDQTDGPINNSYEMGIGWEEGLRRLNQSSEYRRLFQHSYGDGITQDTIKDTLAVFERSLITPNSSGH